MSPNKIFIVESEFLNLADSRIICLGAGEGYITKSSGGQSTQIKYLSKSTDTYNKILLH